MNRSAEIEARRQSALLALLGSTSPDWKAAGIREPGGRAEQGASAYRANADATSDKALANIFPTVQKMLGEVDFRRLAIDFRRASPPHRGDLGVWGDAFPDFIAARDDLRSWPWLADSARLDLAVHDCERAGDAEFDAASLALLESADPGQTRLMLMPGSALVESIWPIAAIHRAHRLPAAEADDAFAEVRSALAESHGESVLVARRGWRAVVHCLEERQVVFTRNVLAGVSLDAALSAALEPALKGTPEAAPSVAEQSFDFVDWLSRAVREQWMRGVEPLVG